MLGFASLAATLLFILSVFVCTFLNSGKLDIYLPKGCKAKDYIPESDIVEIETDPEDQQHMTVIAKGRGKVFINCTSIEDGQSAAGFEYVNVLPGGIIYDMLNGNYSGYRLITMMVQIYLVIITGILLLSFIIRCKTELFSYTTLYFGGTALFLLSIAFNMLVNTFVVAKADEEFTMMYVYSLLKGAGYSFMVLSIPIMALFAVSLAVSNLCLIKREGKSFANLLGFIMSALLAGGYILWFFIDRHFSSGSEKEIRIFNTFTSTYSTVFVYFEAMLLSASICGLSAAKRKPSHDKTHIIVLGCAIADDGTPLPLLRGRIDRAIAFAEEIRKDNGIDVKFVPSGGQGSDEVISEAESMKNYLVSKGISEDRVIIENRSTNTLENMRFSLSKIKEDCGEPKIVFSTSDYHVLRSGMISQNEGLNAAGIGSRTKWYFWPNAFVREFVGLLASKKRQHAFWIIFFILVFAAINIVMPM